MKEGRIPARKTLLMSHPSKKHSSNLKMLFQYRVYIASDARMIDGLKNTEKEVVVA
jgi:hypothetical protein